MTFTRKELEAAAKAADRWPKGCIDFFDNGENLDGFKRSLRWQKNHC